jgi:hypothetical protein
MNGTGKPPTVLRWRARRSERYGRLPAAVFTVVLGAASIGYAFLSGFGGPPSTTVALRHVGAGLAVSAVCGVAAVACLLKALNRSGRSALLVLGLLPALVQAARFLVAEQ